MIVTSQHNFTKNDSMWDFNCMVSLTTNCIMDEKIPFKNILLVIDNHGSLDKSVIINTIVKSFKFLRDGDKLKIYGISELDNCTLLNKQKWENLLKSESVFTPCNGWQYHNYALNPIDGVILITDSPNEFDSVYYQYPVHIIASGKNEGLSHKQLTDMTHGTYNYILNNDEFPRALGSAIGAIFSTYYKDIVIEFQSNANKLINNVHRIDNLYSQEKRDIIVPCIPIVPNNNDIKYSVRAFNVLTREVERMNGTIDLGINPNNNIILERLNELTALNALNKNCKGYLQDDIMELTAARGIKYTCLLQKLSQEYISQRDNRSDRMSKYSTPFRMWYGRELSK